jgi:hypothetical protein
LRIGLVLGFIFVVGVAAQTPPAQLIGRVLEQGKTDGISGATVKLSNGATVVTDKRGWFTFTDVPDGRIAVSAEMIVTNRAPIRSRSRGQHDIEIRFPQPMSCHRSVTVRSRWLEENDTSALERLSPRIITAADLERRGRSTLTEVFGELPSVRVFNVPGSNVRRIVRFMSGDGDESARRSRIPGCEPALYIDGTRYRDRLQPEVPGMGIIDSWDIIAPLAIEAIEIYRGGGAPMMYNDNCGTIMIWTKRGG